MDSNVLPCQRSRNCLDSPVHSSSNRSVAGRRLGALPESTTTCMLCKVSCLYFSEIVTAWDDSQSTCETPKQEYRRVTRELFRIIQSLCHTVCTNAPASEEPKFPPSTIDHRSCLIVTAEVIDELAAAFLALQILKIMAAGMTEVIHSLISFICNWRNQNYCW